MNVREREEKEREKKKRERGRQEAKSPDSHFKTLLQKLARSRNLQTTDLLANRTGRKPNSERFPRIYEKKTK